MQDDFSCCIIAKNEARGLARLLNSLKGVDDIVLVDTGSTDNTIEIAKSFGCNVQVAKPNQFHYMATRQNVAAWKKRYGFIPEFQEGHRYFHFADARNYSLSFAKNDWVFCPDGDEEMQWDLAKVREVIQYEDHLLYPFVYQHNPDGSPGLELQQCKFFRRSMFHWEKWVHEVEQNNPGKNPKPPRLVDFIHHHHWQNVTTARGNYLPGLELSVLQNPNDDRNVFYLGREYQWRGMPKEAISFFEHAVEIQNWLPERSEAHHLIGNCYRQLGRRDKAIESYNKAMVDDPSRREPFFAMGDLLESEGNISAAVVYYQAAMAIPFMEHGYLNSMELYGSKIPDRLAFLYSRLGQQGESKHWWLAAMQNNPDKRMIVNFPYYYGYDLPRVSIVVPTVREEGLKRLVDSIRADDSYPNYEIIDVKGEGTAIEKFNRGVSQAQGKFIVFLADDTEVTPGWLAQAYTCWKENFTTKGLIVLNDGYWGPESGQCTHFFCSKNITEELDGFIFHPGYFHAGVDNELHQRLKKKDMVAYAKDAKIIHHHPFVPTRGTQSAPMDEFYARIDTHLPEDRALLYSRQKKLGFGPKVAVFCITHNNAKIIKRFVKENLKFVDEIYISDNMSTDDTMEIAKAAGAHVQQSFINHTFENYDEGLTKQKALEFAMRESDSEWMLYLDSDEILEPRAKTMLPEMINDLRFDAWAMKKPTFWLGEKYYRSDGDFGAYLNHPYPLSLFKRNIGIRMVKPPKGGHSYPAVNGDVNTPFPMNMGQSELNIMHFSFPTRAEALHKYAYYRVADSGSMMSICVKNYEHIHPDFPGKRLVKWGDDYPILGEVFSEGDFVFDIGANYGQTTDIFKQRGARVLSVEPNPKEFVRINNDLKLQAACADYNGTVFLNLTNAYADPTLSLLATIVKERAHNDYYGPLFSDNNGVDVEAVTLDSLIEKYGMPRHIKIDVEGAEVSVLRGLTKAPHSLSFEILRMQPDFLECFEEVKRIGDYEFTIVGGEDWIPFVPWGPAEESIKYFLDHSQPRSYWQIYARLK